MKIIGLTGGIATGKSTASNIFKTLQIPVIDADKVAREVVSIGKPALKEIEKVFGEMVLNEDGSLDRKKLGKIVFSDPKKLKQLTEITHKKIVCEIENQIKSYRQSKTYKVIVLDAALLIEHQLMYLVDSVWLVVLDQKTQVMRLMNRDDLTEKEAYERLKAQMSTKEKKSYAQVILDNNQDIEYLKGQIIHELKKVNE